ncbi:MAG: HAD-IC family P-type ATPase [Candidatus Liptonbacteria bacterium]|nr:HAD-IC family P-type ATPase [Candidatus Liptonbacteria bacterium]
MPDSVIPEAGPPPAEKFEFKWHAVSAQDALKRAHSSETGLSADEVLARLQKYGNNSLPAQKTRGVFSIFLSQFLSPLISVLMGAAVIVLFMGETADGLIIFFVLFFNAVVGTIQEGKAQNTLKALKEFIEGSATVVRGGKIFIISDKEVVPGDILILQEGEKIPADARIITVHSLRVDESGLTGESIPVGKVAAALSGAAALIQDRKNIVFKGTNIVGGNGQAVVIATGLSTEIGKISKEIASIDTDVPLKKSIAGLSRIIIGAVLGIGGLIFILGILRGVDLRQMFAVVVSLSVSIIPEGLPIVMTLVLASGVWRMTKQNVLVKKLQAVEALGQAKIIAVDKTGTLTKNEMAIQKVYVDGKTYDIGGAGYEPQGEVSFEGTVIDPLNYPEMLLAGRVASFCADAKVVYSEESKKWKVSGDPTEASMTVFAQKVGFKDIDGTSEKILELPFDYLAKYHLTVHKFEGKNFLAAVGAPEKIIELCSRIWRKQKSEKLSPQEKQEIENVFLKLSREGYRVVALAIDPDAEKTTEIQKPSDLIFVGFFGMRDPLREEVYDAVRNANAAGIRIVMITGDHKITAHAIAVEAGIARPEDEVITGDELEIHSDAELLKRFDASNVFARVTPNHKLRIIELFRKRGEVVAMTGDGVNDAPSLAAADLGVAMGIIGTEVAKEAADIVLLDDNFGNIISAVEEGRSIYRTIKKVVLYLFSTSIGEALTIVGAISLGFPLPVLPAQIIWLNLVTDGFLDVALAMEPKEDGLLSSHSAKPSKYILDSFTIKRMAFMGVIIALGTLFIFSQYLDGNIEKAVTVSLTTLAVFQWFNAWNCKNETKSIFSANPFGNIYLVGATLTVIVLQLMAVYNPFFQKFLHTTSLNFVEWVYIVGMAASVLVFEEARKAIWRRK